MRVAAALCLLALGLAACLSPRSVPATPEVEECPLALLEGELVPDDDSGFLVRHEEGFVTPIIWPDGYEVRDGEGRELVDPTGDVVAREGDFVSLGGGFLPDDLAFVVCGPFTVTPAR